jgi:RNA polymerase sigma-70 factor (ECF subfamily)
LRFLIARTGSTTEAEDVLQDLYLRLCNMSDAEEADHIVDQRAFIYRLCLNLVSDNRRGRLRREKRDVVFHDAHARVERGCAIADEPSPEAAVEARLRLNKILTALETMPVQQRRVFRLHRIQGLSYREISENLGISCSAVEKHMSAAIKRLAGWDI